MDPNTVDLTPVVNFYRQYVTKAAKDITLWHWFSGSNRDPVWKTNFTAHAQAGLDHMRNLSSLYYLSWCATGQNEQYNPPDCRGFDRSRLRFGSGNMYGPGIYLSTDPAATINYGEDTNWVLEQITLPVGFNYIDMSSAGRTRGSASLPDDVISVFKQIHCDEALSSYGTALSSASLDTVLHLGSRQPWGGGEICRLALRRVFKDILKVGGFFYAYGASNMLDCSTHDGAFVLTDASQIPDENVLIFNSQSTDAVAERIRIMSLLDVIGGKPRNGSSFDPAPYLAYYGTPGRIQNMPTYVLQSASNISGRCLQTSSGNHCSATARVVDPSNGDIVAVSLAEPPGLQAPATSGDVISRATSPYTVTGRGYMFSNGMIWSDLDGRPFNSDTDAWIPQHIHGCPR